MFHRHIYHCHIHGGRRDGPGKDEENNVLVKGAHLLP